MVPRRHQRRALKTLGNFRRSAVIVPCQLCSTMPTVSFYCGMTISGPLFIRCLRGSLVGPCGQAPFENKAAKVDVRSGDIASDRIAPRRIRFLICSHLDNDTDRLIASEQFQRNQRAAVGLVGGSHINWPTAFARLPSMSATTASRTELTKIARACSRVMASRQAK